MSGCAGDARTNSSGLGLGMQACLLGSTDMGVAGQPGAHASSLGASDQLFNISENGTLRNRGRAGSPGACMGVVQGGPGKVVVQGADTVIDFLDDRPPGVYVPPAFAERTCPARSRPWWCLRRLHST